MSVELKDIIKEENLVYKKTPVLTDNVMHYCPGCSHGVVHKINTHACINTIMYPFP